MTRGRGTLLALAASAALAGCSSGGYQDPTLQTAQNALAMLRGAIMAPDQTITPDPELRSFPSPLMRVTMEKTGVAAIVGPGGENGETVTWYSADRRALSFRRGLLAGTAGFGGDLASAELPDVRGAGGSVTRSHYYLGGDEKMHRVQFNCTIARAGSQTVSVAGAPYATRRVEERCEGVGSPLSFANTYWIEADGTIRQSRQWVSPEIGTLKIEKVNG